MTGLDDQCARTRDASLYVLGELEGRMHQSFARHLRRCEECAEEVELLQQAADAVPLLASRQGPPLDEEPHFEQRPPSLSAAASASRAAVIASRPPSQQPVSRPALRPIDGGAMAGTPAGSGSGRRLLKNPMPKPALIGLLALAVLAIATVALSSRAASTRYVRIQAGWSRGGAALKLQGNQLELLVEGMPKPVHGQGYEVWVVDRAGKQLRPTGRWLHLNVAGEDGVTLIGNYHDWLAVAVYVEPLHGSDNTHSGAVVVGDLRNVGVTGA